jgi:diguanylate cyclase
MNQPPKKTSVIEQFPEEPREAADLLKQAVPLMMRHHIAPNPVHYALWYTYSQGKNPELNKRLDKIVGDFEVFPPETALKLFREHIIRNELEEARVSQQQLVELVDDIEGDVTSSVEGSTAYNESLQFGLQALRSPQDENLPGVLSDLQESTLQMQEQQEKFLHRLRSAQTEIQHLRTQLDRANMAATLDHLTQIFNRNAFTHLLDKALKTDHRGLALVMLDIDHFKHFNDQYGHPLGDRVLQHVGRLLRELLPAQAMAARYGGEEFCVIMRDCHDLQTAYNFAERLRRKIQALRVKMRSTDKVLDSITASFGLALAQAGDDPEGLVTRADEQLYKAKHNGRNQVQPSLSLAALTA